MEEMRDPIKHKLICSLDTGEVGEALDAVRRMRDYCGAFKIGHGLVLPNGLDVIDRLQDAGAERIFLDMKFHDIPSSVAIGVREAAKKKVWMLTVHLSGGPAMITAAMEEAKQYSEEDRPCVVGVSVLTSLDQRFLNDSLGIDRTIEDHMVRLSSEGVANGIDGVVCSIHEARSIRQAIGHEAVIVTPGIRARHGKTDDQTRVGDGRDALDAGADYLVIGRALSNCDDPEKALAELRLGPVPA